MKIPTSFHLLALLTAVFSLTSCEVALQAPFNEADFKPAAGTGSGSVAGRAFVVVTSGNWNSRLKGERETNFAEGANIALFPVNAYTTEIIQKKYGEGANLTQVDPRFSKYTRTLQTDESGNFRFTGIPSGDYYVGCEVSWANYYSWTDDDGTPRRTMHENTVPVHARVSVRNGQSVTVTQWQQGRQKEDVSMAPSTKRNLTRCHAWHGSAVAASFMKTPQLRPLFSLLAVALSFCSCEVPVRQPFHEADFKWTRGKGTGAVDGQAYIEMKDKSVWLGKKTYIVLFPVNAYTTELMTRKYERGENVMGDDRMGRYLCDETADSHGRFSMRDLAPGEYYVGAMVDWVSEYWFPDSDNNLQKNRDNHSQFIYARVTVRNGQTTHVTNWNQGADWNMDTVLH